MTTLRINVNDLTLEYIAELKQRFKNKILEINVFSKLQDETDYLLSNEANRKHLETAMENVKNGNVITYDYTEFIKEYDQKIAAAL